MLIRFVMKSIQTNLSKTEHLPIFYIKFGSIPSYFILFSITVIGLANPVLLFVALDMKIAKLKMLMF